MDSVLLYTDKYCIFPAECVLPWEPRQEVLVRPCEQCSPNCPLSQPAAAHRPGAAESASRAALPQLRRKEEVLLLVP